MTSYLPNKIKQAIGFKLKTIRVYCIPEGAKVDPSLFNNKPVWDERSGQKVLVGHTCNARIVGDFVDAEVAGIDGPLPPEYMNQVADMIGGVPHDRSLDVEVTLKGRSRKRWSRYKKFR